MPPRPLLSYPPGCPEQLQQDTPRRWRCRRYCASDRVPGGAGGVRNCAKSDTLNMNHFQHKNVLKIVDNYTRTCYYIDNTRTCNATTKQEETP